MESKKVIISKLKNAQKQGKLSGDAYQNILKWLKDKDYQKKLIALITREKFSQLNDCFFRRIYFGTGGMRGQRGIGPNRINTRTLGEAAQGLANYLKKEKTLEAKKQGVVVAYDTRVMSREFAEEVSRVLAGNRIKTYLFAGPRPTPELSFAVRELKAAAGVVISASHNPPEDNGFKVYASDGGQIVAPQDKEITREVEKVRRVKKITLREARQKKLFQKLGKELDEKYLSALTTISLNKDRDIKIVYSPLHGTGLSSIVPVLKKLGFHSFRIVSSQQAPDGRFPNVKGHKPNPEEDETLEEAVKTGKKYKADLAMVSDPDADRLRVAVRDKANQWQLLTGNQLGSLLVYYVLSTLKKQKRLPQKGVIAKTIVTTDLISQIASAFKVRVVDHLLVGFKYIGELIKNLEGTEEEFVFGAEESLGYLSGTFIRDKEAAVAAILTAEYAAQLKKQGLTLCDALDELYQKYGYYSEKLISLSLPGAAGMVKIKNLMKSLREKPPLQIGKFKVRRIIDRLTGEVYLLPEKEKIGNVEGVKGDVLIFYLSDDGQRRVTIRPSGTEPKVKLYIAFSSKVKKELQSVKREVEKWVEEITTEIRKLAYQRAKE
jgi:phosphomannomutase